MQSSLGSIEGLIERRCGQVDTRRQYNRPAQEPMYLANRILIPVGWHKHGNRVASFGDGHPRYRPCAQPIQNLQTVRLEFGRTDSLLHVHGRTTWSAHMT